MRFFPIAVIVQVSFWMPSAFALDLNSDGMSDIWQQIYSVPSADANKDYDGTGLTNVQKSQLGLDPRNPSSRFYLELIRDSTQNQLRIRIDTAYGKLYQVESSTDRYNWSAVGPVITGTGNQVDVITTMPSPSLSLLFRHRFVGDKQLSGDLFTTWEKHQLGLNEQVLDTSGDGIPDWWKWEYGLNLFANDANLDPTGKGITVFQDYRNGTDPTNYYDGSLPLDEKLPMIQILSGNGQSAQPGNWLYEPLVLNVTDYAGAPLQNAPIVFQVTQGGGFLSTTSGGATAPSLTAYCDAYGVARVYVQAGAVAGTSVITASAINGSQMTQVTFTATSDSASPPAAVATPSYSPDGGYFAGQRTISIGCSTSGATIHYTTNGQDPTESDPTVASGSTIVFGRSFMLKARAWKSGLFPSHIKASPFIITGAVASGHDHTLHFGVDGVLWANGSNNKGQLGVGNSSTTRSLVPVQVQFPPGNPSPVVSASAGYWHSIALTADGTTWGWGYNANGSVGDSSTTDRYAPVPVQFPSGNQSPVVAVSASDNASFALTADGTVWSWGSSGNGELGNNLSTSPTPNPVQFPPGNTFPVIAISAGSGHCLALKADGSVWAWGDNGHFQLGNNSNAPYSAVPVRVQFPNNAPRAISVTGGPVNSGAVTADGTLWVWGYNNQGEYGNDSTTGGLVPVPVHFPPGGTAAASNVAFGYSYVIAAKTDGTVWGWGSGGYNAINGPEIHSPRQIQIPFNRQSGPVVAVAANWYQSFAIRADGAVIAWGYDTDGELGDGSQTSKVPIQIVKAYDRDGDGLSDWFEIQIGSDPNNPDTSGLGLGDAAIVALGYNPANNDFNNDGISNLLEIQIGLNAFWANPTLATMPPANPNDHTPPVITITFPTSGITPL